MNSAIVHIARFLIIGLVQIFIINQLEIGIGVLPMVYPLVLFLLPIEMNVVGAMLLGFGFGFIIDSMSNTFGLHASSLLLFAYMRPWVLKKFAPRENYDLNKEGNIYNMGPSWFFYTFGTLLLIHHFWFFVFEVANFGEFFYILQKTILSVIVSFLLCIGLQIIFVKKPKER
ncbi:MAG: hypothetical protein ACI9G9_000429 [Psychromonas sp.]|jgi:hypothetical protein